MWKVRNSNCYGMENKRTRYGVGYKIYMLTDDYYFQKLLIKIYQRNIILILQIFISKLELFENRIIWKKSQKREDYIGNINVCMTEVLLKNKQLLIQK